MDRTKKYFSLNQQWPDLRDGIRTHIKVCNACQINKKQDFKCGKLTAKKAEVIPWERLLVDLIGSYKIRREGRDEPLIIKYLNNNGKSTSEFNIRNN